METAKINRQDPEYLIEHNSLGKEDAVEAERA